MITRLRKHGTLLVIVDQPAAIGTLPVAVAQAENITVANLHPGETKADARDAARSIPQTLRSIQDADTNVTELSMLCGYDDDQAKQATATSNRIRGLLTQIHPWLETVIGPHLDHPAILAVLAKYPTPKALRHAGKHRVETLLRGQAPRRKIKQQT